MQAFSSSRRGWAATLAAFVVATVVLTAVAWRTIPAEKVCPDFIQFWTAATALSDGRNPYDPALQASVQGSLGWERDRQGLGIYDFLPYYYPPWLGLAFLPFLLLDYGLAKLLWLVLGAEMLVASALLLGRSVRSLPVGVVVAVSLCFAFALKAVAMGQVAPLVLLLLAATLRLLETRRDLAAGCVMSLLTIKPQLSGILVVVVLAWTARHGRWKVWQGFASALAGLCIVATAVFPAWLPSMLAATRVTPMPTAWYPGLGTTWLVALDAVGLHGPLLYVALAVAAVPLLLGLFRLTLGSRSEPIDLFSLALIASFFLAPYARHYDFPILVIPALALLDRMTNVSRATLAIALTVLPALHLLRLTAAYVPPVVGVRRPEFTYFWIPLMLAFVWLCCGSKGSREDALLRPADNG